MGRIIERLFFRLTEVYPEFNGDPADWQEAISDLSTDEIKHGLERLDPAGYCPTPAEFRGLCEARAKDAIKVLQETAQKSPERPPLNAKPQVNMQGSKAWAHRLKERYEAGETLTAIQISYAEHVCGRFVKNKQ
jgi:hypothetical protein